LIHLFTKKKKEFFNILFSIVVTIID